MHATIPTIVGFRKRPWNKGRLIGQKRPLRPKEVWAIRVRLQLGDRKRDLALFNLAIDSKLPGCDLVSLQVEDVFAGSRARDRATVIQKKTGRPAQFEIREQTRSSIRDWLSEADLREGCYLFPSRFRAQPHLSTRHGRAIAAGASAEAGRDDLEQVAWIARMSLGVDPLKSSSAVHSASPASVILCGSGIPLGLGSPVALMQQPDQRSDGAEDDEGLCDNPPPQLHLKACDLRAHSGDLTGIRASISPGAYQGVRA
jgi:hypothetical protein